MALARTRALGPAQLQTCCMDVDCAEIITDSLKKPFSFILSGQKKTSQTNDAHIN